MGVAKMIIRPILPIALLLIIFAALIACTFWGVIRTSLKRKEKIFTVLRLGIIYVLVLIIGLRPMVTDEEYEFSTRNLDVIFVVDTTISMWATDYYDGGSRIEGAKRDAKQIVDELAGSNFALMTFDDQSHVISPCTQDMEHVKTLLDTLAPPGYEYAGGSDMSLPYKDLESLLLSSSRKEERKRHRQRLACVSLVRWSVCLGNPLRLRMCGVMVFPMPFLRLWGVMRFRR